MSVHSRVENHYWAESSQNRTDPRRVERFRATQNGFSHFAAQRRDSVPRQNRSDPRRNHSVKERNHPAPPRHGVDRGMSIPASC